MSGKRSTGREKLLRLCERFDWTCHLCGREIPRDYIEQSPVAPSRDHVLPRRTMKKRTPKQYSETFLANNIRPAHKWCNERRGHKKSTGRGSTGTTDKYSGLFEAQERFEKRQSEQGALV